jgi:hypothetical protein
MERRTRHEHSSSAAPQSIAIGQTDAGPRIARRGSRSRTQRARPCCGYRMARGKWTNDHDLIAVARTALRVSRPERRSPPLRLVQMPVLQLTAGVMLAHPAPQRLVPQCGPQHALTFMLPAYASTAATAGPRSEFRAVNDGFMRFTIGAVHPVQTARVPSSHSPSRARVETVRKRQAKLDLCG